MGQGQAGGLFSRATELESVGPDHFRAPVEDGWAIHGNLNGGFLMALAVKAALAGNADHPDPLAVSGHYTGPVVKGEVDMHRRLLAGSRSTSVYSVRLEQSGNLCCFFTVTGTNLDMARGMDLELRTPPALPDIESCRAAQAPDRPVPLEGRLDIQYPPGSCWWEGENAGSGRYECWLRHVDGADPDALSLLLFMDAIPPAVFSLVRRPGWVPTVALSLQVRAHPAPGPVRMRVQTQSVGRGLVEEDTEVWDSSDRLVGLSRQLLKLRHVQ
ncbi:MAG: thioesterase family protein [Gammaproteobacteria bacterium AqS3]|nr:thioesterase family protein [Gammaproteobacteria bacterium AqS3]